MLKQVGVHPREWEQNILLWHEDCFELIRKTNKQTDRQKGIQERVRIGKAFPGWS